MKLSEMSTKEGAKVLCKIAPAVEELGKDKGLADAFVKIGEGFKDKEKTLLEVITGTLAKLIPVMLDTHEKATYCIIAAMSGKTEKAIAEQKMMVTIKDCADFIDKDFIDFFKSVGDAAEKKSAE